MHIGKFAFVAALASAAAATADVQPAVQPGGDIPPHFQPVPAIPKGGDVPRVFTAPRAEFQYVRREAMIPMRDGVRLYTVIVVPKEIGRAHV